MDAPVAEAPAFSAAAVRESLARFASVTRGADRLTLHTARMSAGVSSPQFVGRAKELAALSDALAGAADGNPSVVMVLGVSGVGKTRLVTEFGDEARARDMRVLVGNCLELTTGDLPLGPVATILRDLIRTVGQDRVATVLGEARDELARLVPALASSDACHGGRRRPEGPRRS